MREEITTRYETGTSQEVTLHDGSVVHLHKADESLDINSRRSALKLIKDYKADNRILTGLLYMDSDSQDLHEVLNTSNKPLRSLKEADLCPGSNVLGKINDSFR